MCPELQRCLVIIGSLRVTGWCPMYGQCQVSSVSGVPWCHDGTVTRCRADTLELHTTGLNTILWETRQKLWCWNINLFNVNVTLRKIGHHQKRLCNEIKYLKTIILPWSEAWSTKSRHLTPKLKQKPGETTCTSRQSRIQIRSPPQLITWSLSLTQGVGWQGNF